MVVCFTHRPIKNDAGYTYIMENIIIMCIINFCFLSHRSRVCVVTTMRTVEVAITVSF